jgi:hypothetical protein
MVPTPIAVIPVHDTPFVATGTVLPDREGREELIVLFKATYDVSRRGHVVPAEEQDAILHADQHHGNATSSSIAWAAEATPALPSGTDVFLIGDAVAPTSGTKELEVSFRVGSVHKRARVLGTRAWHPGALGAASHTAPEPFDRIPLRYENAFGGLDQSAPEAADWDREAYNPVGRGFRAARSQRPWEQTLLPNLEDLADPVKSPDGRYKPVAFGPIGRHWEPRIQYVGTYDETWASERMPLLPDDFDNRFHHAAPPDQIVSGYVLGAEAVEVVGCDKDPIVFALPEMKASVTVRFFLREEQRPLRCEMVVVDALRSKLTMLHRCVLPLQGDVLDLRTLTIETSGGAT